MSTSELTKKPYKLVEIPVNNFNDLAIPHHSKLLTEHKEIVQKEHDDLNKMRNESASIKRLIAQLKGLLYELDTLRAQVIDADLDKFDQKTVSLRKTILKFISEYTVLLKQTAAYLNPQVQPHTSQNDEIESAEPKQLQISANIDELKLHDKENCLKRVENLHTDIQDLHSAYGSLHQMVVEQQDDVNAVETHVEEAQHNVQAASRHIITAARLKKSIYPVTGAIVGTCVGGPIGLVAGLKIGGLAALGCGLLGYFGGNVIKKQGTPTDIVTPNVETIDTVQVKKDE